MKKIFTKKQIESKRRMKFGIISLHLLCCTARFCQFVDAWHHQFRWIPSSTYSGVKLNAQRQDGRTDRTDRTSQKLSSPTGTSNLKAEKDGRNVSVSMRSGTKDSKKSRGKNVFLKDQLDFKKGFAYCRIEYSSFFIESNFF